MAYRLEPDEPIRDGLRRVIVEQLDRAVTRIDDHDDASVHDVRTSLKKARAALRLTQGGFPGFGRENATLRDAGRTLSATRDAQVVVTTLDGLLDEASPEEAPALREVRDALGPVAAVTAAPAAAGPERTADRSAEADSVPAVLAASRQRAEVWDLDGVRMPTLEQGLARTYGRGRRTLVTASREPTTTALHAWRRRVKDLWYQLRLVEPAWPPLVAAQIAAAGTLGEQLGADHDLQLVDRAITGASASDEVARRAAAVVVRRRRAIQRDAFVLGQRLYVESARSFSERTMAYVRLWRAEARVTPPAG